MGRVINILMCLVVVLLLGVLTSFAVASYYNYSILNVMFWVGLCTAVVGAMSSVTGNPTGSRVFGGNADSQFQSYANIETLQMERKSTNYFNNFTKHGVIESRAGSIGCILAGVILFMVSYLFS